MSLKELFEAKKVFKLVCGAGNEDLQEVEKLVAIYAKAGCQFFDLNASKDVVKAAKRGLDFSISREVQSNYHFCISVGTSQDPHISKAFIDADVCIACGACYDKCSQLAIKNGERYSVIEKRCIGCASCAKVCPVGAINLQSQKKILSEILTPQMKDNISVVEFHCMDENDLEVKNYWSQLCDSFDGVLSISLGRKKLSDEKILRRIKNMIEQRAPYSVVIQADGNPMSGGEDSYDATLQAVACAQVIQSEKLPVYVLLSGGTNSKTAELAKQCGVSFDGVAVGSYARKIVRKYLDMPNLLDDENNFEKAVKIAQELIEKNS